MIFFFALIILIISFYLALRSLREFEIPDEIVKKLKKKRNISGIILFLTNKIIHYQTGAIQKEEEKHEVP